MVAKLPGGGKGYCFSPATVRRRPRGLQRRGWGDVPECGRSGVPPGARRSPGYGCGAGNGQRGPLARGEEWGGHPSPELWVLLHPWLPGGGHCNPALGTPPSWGVQAAGRGAQGGLWSGSRSLCGRRCPGTAEVAKRGGRMGRSRARPRHAGVEGRWQDRNRRVAGLRRRVVPLLGYPRSSRRDGGLRSPLVLRKKKGGEKKKEKTQ